MREQTLFEAHSSYVLALLFAVLGWWKLVCDHDRARSAELDRLVKPVLAFTAFAALTGGVGRTCHHWAQIPWNREALFTSDTVQTSLSIVWGTLAITMMILGNRRKHRSVWIAGAVLVGVVVIKLFLIELSAVGTLQRIVSFVVVGLLLLLVGFIAPLPPRLTDESPQSPEA